MAAPAPTSKPHAIAIPLFSQGHINPLMRFCKILASHGFIVTFVNIDPIHHRLLECLQQQHPQPESNLVLQDTKPLDIRRAHIPLAGLQNMAEDFRIPPKPFFEATEGLFNPLTELIDRLSKEGPPVTFMISDIFLSGVTQKVADEFNIPRIALFPSSLSVNLFDVYLHTGQISVKDAAKAILERNSRPADLFREGLPGLPPLRNADLQDFTHVVNDNDYAYPYLARQLKITSEKAHALVVNSFDDLERPAMEALRQHLRLPVYGVGPLIEELVDESSTSLWKEDHGCLRWLQSQPRQSVLYISFGSLTLLSKQQFEEVLMGLEGSKVRFLWAFRPDLVEGEAKGVVPEDFLQRTKERGYVVTWAPQVRVLSHPSVGGFLTHCGWNSTVESIANGVPMLCWPYFADQFMDAKFIVEEWKVGLRFIKAAGEGGVVGREEVQRVVKALMQESSEIGKAVRKNAANLKEAARLSLQEGGSSHTSIQTIIQAFSITPHSI